MCGVTGDLPTLLRERAAFYASKQCKRGTPRYRARMVYRLNGAADAFEKDMKEFRERAKTGSVRYFGH